MSNTDLTVTTQKTDKVISFFDNRFEKKLEFSTNDFDAVTNFFEKREFGRVAAKTLAQVLLSEAKKENIKIFQLLDTLTGLNRTQLNSIILKILNESREKTSQLGFRSRSKLNHMEERNIVDVSVVSDEIRNWTLNSIVDSRNVTIGRESHGNMILVNKD